MIDSSSKESGILTRFDFSKEKMYIMNTVSSLGVKRSSATLSSNGHDHEHFTCLGVIHSHRAHFCLWE